MLLNIGIFSAVGSPIFNPGLAPRDVFPTRGRQATAALGVRFLHGEALGGTNTKLLTRQLLSMLDASCRLKRCFQASGILKSPKLLQLIRKDKGKVS